MNVAPPSKNSVRKAGSTIRRHARGEASDAELDAALEVVVAFRAQFTSPLVKVNNALRSFCRSLGMPDQVTQRLKKSATIRDKLSREAGLDLSRMQDIGGCRVVFQNLSDLRLVEERIRRTWGHALDHHKDYIESPRDSGYRAVHLVVRRDGCQIEIQLRTEAMHAWAELVEAFSGITGENFKQDGEHVVQQFMKALSEQMACTDAGVEVPSELLDRTARLRVEVSTHLQVLRQGLERNK